MQKSNVKIVLFLIVQWLELKVSPSPHAHSESLTAQVSPQTSHNFMMTFLLRILAGLEATLELWQGPDKLNIFKSTHIVYIMDWQANIRLNKLKLISIPGQQFALEPDSVNDKEKERCWKYTNPDNLKLFIWLD